MRLFITGNTGFVGQNLSKYLSSKNFGVLGLSLRDENWRNNLNNHHADAIVHLAGKAHDTSNVLSENEYFEVNRDLTISLYQEFLKSDIKDFFFFSSVKAVSDAFEGILTEEVSPNPKTPYGRSKQEAEQYLLNQKLPKGKRLFIIRPCMIHGPGNKGNLNLLFKIVEKGLPWPLAKFENERSFLSINNLSFLVHQMLQNLNIQSGVYNFSDDQSVSTNELIRIISNSIGKKPRLWNIPIVVINSAVKFGDIFSLPLNTERLQKLTENYVVSNQKVKLELGINKLPLTTEEGLILTVQSFQK